MIAKIMTAKKYFPPTAKIYLLAIRNPSKTGELKKKQNTHKNIKQNKTRRKKIQRDGGGKWENY